MFKNDPTREPHQLTGGVQHRKGNQSILVEFVDIETANHSCASKAQPVGSSLSDLLQSTQDSGLFVWRSSARMRVLMYLGNFPHCRLDL